MPRWTPSRLADSALSVIKEFGFDGLDLDWEFPSWSGAPWADRLNFVSLLAKLRSTFDNDEFPEKRYLLTAAVSAAYTIIEVSYDVPKIAE